MKRLLDINTWIALTVEAHPHHLFARQWFDATTVHRGELIFCSATEIGLVRLLTQAALMKQYGRQPLTNSAAIFFLKNLCSDLAVSREPEPENVRGLWLLLSAKQTASPNKWMDAYLAAFAIASNAELVTFDRGFLEYQPRGLSLHLLETA